MPVREKIGRAKSVPADRVSRAPMPTFGCEMERGDRRHCGRREVERTVIREYKTIQEMSGPLMVVNQVQGVTYDELGEIELPDGERPPLPGAGGQRRHRRGPAV